MALRRVTKKLTPADEVWHELVLNGIGGCTIREAKERIDYDEYRAWVAYLKKRGSLNGSYRLEWSAGSVSRDSGQGRGVKCEPDDFRPHVRGR